jgi:transketolase
MAAIMNGIALHGGFVPYGATFLIFMEYARNAVRLSALMGVQNILVYTHDSLALGEDGPTHQPVEQLATLRMTPGLENWRPADQVETAFAWQAALQRTRAPTSLILSRQGLPCPERTPMQVHAIARGGYVLVEAEDPQVVLVATGSEVALAVEAAAELTAAGTPVRVVSVPCLERFLAQDAGYRDEVLPQGVPRLVIEAAHPGIWWRIAGDRGDVLGVETFGTSAPGGQAMAEYGFTVEHVTERARNLIA